MTQNMGMIDRSVRGIAVVPSAVVLALVVGPATLGGILLFVVAAIMAVTAVTGYCPTYTVVGISTRPRPHRIPRVAHTGVATSGH